MSFVEILLSFDVFQGLAESVNQAKLVDCVFVQLVDRIVCLLAQSLLVVS